MGTITSDIETLRDLPLKESSLIWLEQKRGALAEKSIKNYEFYIQRLDKVLEG